MICNSCSRMGGVKAFSRRFFYYIAIFCILTALICLLCACDDDVDDNFDKDILLESVTFVLNNGEKDIVCTAGDSIPTPTKEGQYLVGWYLDEGFENKMDFNSMSELLSGLNFAEVTSEDCKLYAKWEDLKSISGVRVKTSTFIYDGEKHDPILENLPENANISFISDGDCTDVGTYNVMAVIEAYGYKEFRLSCTLNVKKARIDMSDIAFEDKTVTWNGSEHSIFISGELPSGVSVSYENNGHSDVGEYDIVAHFQASANFESIDDMTAKLKISAKTYEVTFVEEDGDSHVRTVTHGDNLGDYPEPKAKRGYVGRWSELDYDSIVGGVATVHAEYTLENYSINYVLNGGSLQADAASTFTINDEVLLPTAERDYYTFDGWYDNSELDGDSVTRILKDSAESKTYYAKWTAIEYAVTYDLRGGVNNSNNLNKDGKFIYTVSDAKLTLENPSRRGYEFVCWENEHEDRMTEIDFNAPQNITVFAKWRAIRYTVTYALNGGEVFDVLKTNYTVEDDDIALTAPVKRGYTFGGWFDNAEFGGDALTKIDADMENRNISLFAKWDIIDFEIHYTLNGGELDADVINTFNINDGEITLPSPTRNGYIFDGWFDNANFLGESREVINPAVDLKNVDIFAKWTVIKYKITYILDEGANNAGNPPSFTVEDDSIALAAPLKEGYEFKGWYFSADFLGNEVNTISPAICKDITVYAKWEYIVRPFTLENINGKNIITSYNYNLGASVTVPLEIDGAVVDGVRSGVLSQAESVTINTCWTEICSDMFAGCTKLKTLVLPKTLESMTDGLLADCIALENLTVPFVGLSKFDGSDGTYFPFAYLFSDVQAEEYLYAVTAKTVEVESGLSRINEDITTVKYVPHTLRNVTVLGGDVATYALSGLISVVNVTFEGDVSSLGAFAMRNCVNLKSVEFPQAANDIQASVFLGCESLEKVSAYSSAKDMVKAAVGRVYTGEDIEGFEFVWLDEQQ